MALLHGVKLRIWYKIERICFKPRVKGQQAWLNNFCGWLQAVHELTGHLYSTNALSLQPDEIDLGILKLRAGLKDNYSVKISIPLDVLKVKGDDADVLTEPVDAKLNFDFDSRYASNFDYITEDNEYMPSDDEFTENNIAETLNDFIAHPASHVHLANIIPEGEKLEDGKERSSEFRITTETRNPFVFLYQLAFQLLEPKERCGIEKEANNRNKKEIELARMAKVIYDNRDKDIVGPGFLFRM